ncbi:aspartic peptidase domain-containing protein [Zalerion maritima]|uniref:Aspartic peptidase domain-containing protein n=1 Tax=Zalerion maritima TaxID=339359 RepID=A0AAD5RJT2_9PEZI|nr:aspartic peptidase domain-containing protein [Zalerion maritima]
MLPKRAASCIFTALLSAPFVQAKYEAHWVQPADWHGADGNWSSILILAGEGPAQGVDVLVSTVLAESWVVDADACPDGDENPDGFYRCVLARGGTFNRTASTSWNPLGLWNVGLSYLGITENAEYGVDGIVLYTQGDSSVSFESSSIAAITTPEYNNGFFGLGIVGTSFGQRVAVGPIDAMAKISQVMTSRSYGFTAGAHYALQGYGSPLSLTLGGYDKNRFQSHDINFDMDGGYPAVKVRAIEASSAESDSAPSHWSSTTETLLMTNESVDALIDSTTPHLWLPSTICDRFALAFNLTWDEDIGYHVYGGSESDGTQLYSQFKRNTDIMLKFTLSDTNNNDLFDNDREVVNITVPVAAFTSLLSYPFANLNYGDESLPYFTLKRTTNSSKIILGRSFMQEAYLRANYDPPRFSVHQVKFPDDYSDTDIETINHVAFPLAEEEEEEEGGLSTSALAGIVFAGCAVVTALVVTLYCRRRRRKSRRARELAVAVGESKAEDSDVDDRPPHTPAHRILSLFSWWKKPKKTQSHVPHAINKDEPVEVAADEDHARYELPVPIEPVELDADADRVSINGTTELGTGDTRNMSAYDVARRKLERQLQGPVPAYTPPAEGSMHAETSAPEEKSYQDVSMAGHYRPPDSPSPVDPSTLGNAQGPIPSPLLPHPDWPQRISEFASPMTTAPPFLSPRHDDNSSNPESSDSANPLSPHSPYSPSSLSRTNSARSARSPVASRHTQPPPLSSLIETQTHSRRRNAPSPTSPASQSPTSIHSSGTLHSGHLPHSPLSAAVNGLAANSTELPGPAIQRTPIDPSKVVCLGPLPNNVQLPGLHQPPSLPSIPRVVGPDGQSLLVPPMHHAEENNSVDTLGSNFTDEEEARFAQHDVPQLSPTHQRSPMTPSGPKIPPTAAQAVAAATARRPMPPAIHTGLAPINVRSQGSDEDAGTPRSPMRIDSGLDIVHVPQVAERRYSWEEERS